MLSKLLRSGCQRYGLLLSKKSAQLLSRRRVFGLIPPNQYDTPLPNKLKIGYVLKEYWETIPLFFTTAFAFIVVLGGGVSWAVMNKMDVVYSTHNRCCISRTMDMRNPTVHKMMTVTQRYEPWPEMADALDKIAAAEKRALMRLQTCNIP